MGGKRPLLRMDMGPLDKGHGGPSGLKFNEIDVIKGNRFHMHVLKWGK